MYSDPEINALSHVYEALKGLDNSQIKRIVDWVSSRFGPDKQAEVTVSQIEVEVSPRPQTVEAAEPALEPVKKRRGHPPEKARAEIEEAVPKPVSTGITGFMKYDTLEELFNASNVKKNAAKVLLAAAYLQEKENYKKLSSYDISSTLRKLGEGVYNTSYVIISLMSKKPPQLIQIGNKGVKHSKRKLRVTGEGLRIANNYINE